MEKRYALKRLIFTTCIIYGLMLAGCESNDYDNSVDPPATTISPAHGDVLVPDTSVSDSGTMMHNDTTLLPADSMAAAQPKAVY